MKVVAPADMSSRAALVSAARKQTPPTEMDALAASLAAFSAAVMSE